MPTRAQVEASRRRNRKRGYDEAYIRQARDGIRDRDQLAAEAKAGPRFTIDDHGRMHDAWGGDSPPAA